MEGSSRLDVIAVARRMVFNTDRGCTQPKVKGVFSYHSSGSCHARSLLLMDH